MDFSPKDSIKTNLTKILKTIKSFPIVLKPYEGAGSVGIQIVNNEKDLTNALQECSKIQKLNPTMSVKFLAQEYIDGEEGFLDFYSFNGKHLLTDAWIYNKQRVGNKTLYIGLVLNMKKTPLLAKAEAYCRKILDAIGYKWGPTHIEVKYDKKGVCLIEVNMRVMGTHSLPQQPVFFDYSTPELAFLSLTNSPLLSKYLNKNVYDKSKKLCQILYIIHSPYNFVAGKINVKKFVENLPTFKELISSIKTNDHVKQSGDLFDAIGEISLLGSEKQVKIDFEKIRKSWENDFKS
jgi:hypothetical protein